MHKAKIAYNKGYRATGNGDVIGVRGKPLSLILDTKGYPSFYQRIGGVTRRTSVHRLVAYQKFGEAMFEAGIEVRHLDNNRQNNSWDNIAIGTKRENTMDVPLSVRRRNAINAGRANSSLSKTDVRNIRGRLASGATYREIMEEYNIAKSTVSYINNRVTWKDV